MMEDTAECDVDVKAVEAVDIVVDDNLDENDDVGVWIDDCCLLSIVDNEVDEEERAYVIVIVDKKIELFFVKIVDGCLVALR
jgi:hypothetical protein